jgi:hypothetical protein
MGLSLRAYAGHRGVSHTAVQKTLRAGRIAALPDGTIDPVVADAAWNAAADASRDNGTAPADSQRVVLPARSFATAEATVRTVLADHGMVREGPLRLQDVRVANELLRAQLRADTIRAQRARVHYFTGVDLDAQDEDAAEEAAGWWAWCDTTAGTLAMALGIRRTRLHERLAVALRARLVALGLVAGDDEDEDEEDDADHDQEDDDDDDDVEPLRVEPNEDDHDEEPVADAAGGAVRAAARLRRPDSGLGRWRGVPAAARRRIRMTALRTSLLDTPPARPVEVDWHEVHDPSRAQPAALRFRGVSGITRCALRQSRTSLVSRGGVVGRTRPRRRRMRPNQA